MKRVAPGTAGGPAAGGRWVRTRLRGRSAALKHRARPTTRGRRLRADGYGPRGHRTRRTGKAHAGRDAQVRHVQAPRRAFAGAPNPRGRTDAKPRERVGVSKNPGRRWGRRATAGNAHGFPTDAVAQAAPDRVYDPELDRGPVCVGTSGNTADLAVGAVRDGWRRNGQRQDRGGTALLIGADGGGSNGPKSRRFALRSPERADETGRAVTVCHAPPGASKWNPIEHRLFSRITATRAGVVRAAVAVRVGRIRRATTATGLTVTARVMPGAYPTGRKVSVAAFEAINPTRPDTCPQGNYTIEPRTGGKNTA